MSRGTTTTAYMDDLRSLASTRACARDEEVRRFPIRVLLARANRLLEMVKPEYYVRAKDEIETIQEAVADIAATHLYVSEETAELKKSLAKVTAEKMDLANACVAYQRTIDFFGHRIATVAAELVPITEVPNPTTNDDDDYV